ncbi:hypothetical protein GALMADRAFT_250178, partial [Galerina marginata CBS 339.88]
MEPLKSDPTRLKTQAVSQPGPGTIEDPVALNLELNMNNMNNIHTSHLGWNYRFCQSARTRAASLWSLHEVQVMRIRVLIKTQSSRWGLPCPPQTTPGVEVELLEYTYMRSRGPPFRLDPSGMCMERRVQYPILSFLHSGSDRAFGFRTTMSSSRSSLRVAEPYTHHLSTIRSEGSLKSRLCAVY